MADAQLAQHSSLFPDPADSQLDLDVTVLAFAQWVSQMKTRQHNSQHQMQAEMSIIRNAITSNNTELSDFKRHGAGIQQQMQSEINDIREALANVFMEITSVVRNNSAADQDIKLKIQSLNEQAVRNETAFAQLADAADQSQSKLRSAVQEMQQQSERMHDELTNLNRYTENLGNTLSDKADRMSQEIEQLSQQQRQQLQRRRDHLEKMVHDVQLIGDSLQTLIKDFGEQKEGSGRVQKELQASIYQMEMQQGRGRVTAGAAPVAQGRACTPVRGPVTTLVQMPGTQPGLMAAAYRQPAVTMTGPQMLQSPAGSQNLVYR